MPDFPPVFTAEELEVYKYLAAKLDPSIMNINAVGTGTFTPTEDIVLYGFYFVKVGTGETKPICDHGSGLLPFGGVRVKAGEPITGCYSGSGIVYAKVSDMVYANARAKYYERLKKLLALNRADLTVRGSLVTVKKQLYTVDFTTGSHGTIIVSIHNVGISWLSVNNANNTVSYFADQIAEGLMSIAQDYIDLNWVGMPMKSLPPNTAIRMGLWGNYLSKPSTFCNGQIWTYDVPSDW